MWTFLREKGCAVVRASFFTSFASEGNFKSQYFLVFRCLADSPYADVCFLVHGVPMPAHRVILNARSSYFAHMFVSKWRDRPIIELKHKLVRSPVGLLLYFNTLIITISICSLFGYVLFSLLFSRLCGSDCYITHGMLLSNCCPLALRGHPWNLDIFRARFHLNGNIDLKENKPS